MSVTRIVTWEKSWNASASVTIAHSASAPGELVRRLARARRDAPAEPHALALEHALERGGRRRPVRERAASVLEPQQEDAALRGVLTIEEHGVALDLRGAVRPVGERRAVLLALRQLDGAGTPVGGRDP